jgi:hypothetical protein
MWTLSINVDIVRRRVSQNQLSTNYVFSSGDRMVDLFRAASLKYPLEVPFTH